MICHYWCAPMNEQVISVWILCRTSIVWEELQILKQSIVHWLKTDLCTISCWALVQNMQNCTFMVVLCRHEMTRLGLECVSFCKDTITEPGNACGGVISAALTGKGGRGDPQGGRLSPSMTSITETDAGHTVFVDLRVSTCHRSTHLVWWLSCLRSKSTDIIPLTQGGKISPIETY